MAKEKTDWVKWVAEKLGEHPTKNFKFGQMAFAYAFYRGDQYMIWDEKLGVIREVNIPRETRSVYNICRPFVDIYTAKMLKGDPVPRFKPYPENTERNDEDVSLVANGMVEYWWKSVVEGSAKLRKQNQWGAITGIAIGKMFYDKDMASSMYQGDIAWETVNPFHFFCNPDARSDDEMRWVIHRFPMEKKVVEERFNIKVDSLSADVKQESEMERIQLGRSVDKYVAGEEESTVFVHDIWVKACDDYPLKWVGMKDENGDPVVDEQTGQAKGEWTGGKHVIVAGGKTLVDELNSEPEMLPFFTFPVKALPDELYGQGVLKNILIIQRDMNRIESIVQGNSSWMGNVKWLVNRQANLEPAALNNEEYEVVFYDGVEPKLSQAEGVSAQIANRWWDLYRKAQIVTGLQDNATIPYRGSQTSPGVMKELKSSEDVIFAPDVAYQIDYIRKLIRRYFYLARKYYTEERIVNVIGENRKPEVRKFNAQKIPRDFDTDIDIGSGFSQSQENKMNQLLQFAQTGIFDKIPGLDWRSIGEELLGYAGLNKIKENMYQDELQARQNLDLVLAGEQAPYSKYANFPIHVKVFTDYTKRPEYRDLEVEIRNNIDDYIDGCNMFIQQKAMEAAAMQAAQQNAGQPPMMGPGNNRPQAETGSEKAEASANRRKAAGQPVANTDGQPEMGA